MEINKRAYNQLSSILDCLKESEYVKIPEAQIRFIDNKKDASYNYCFDPTKDLTQNDIMPDTISLLIAIWDMYLATDRQHERLVQTLIERDFEVEQKEAMQLQKKTKRGRRHKRPKQTKIKISEIQQDIIIEATEEQK